MFLKYNVHNVYGDAGSMGCEAQEHIIYIGRVRPSGAKVGDVLCYVNCDPHNIEEKKVVAARIADAIQEADDSMYKQVSSELFDGRVNGHPGTVGYQYNADAQRINIGVVGQDSRLSSVLCSIDYDPRTYTKRARETSRMRAAFYAYAINEKEEFTA